MLLALLTIGLIRNVNEINSKFKTLDGSLTKANSKLFEFVTKLNQEAGFESQTKFEDQI